MVAATAGLSIRGFGVLGASALGREASLGPKPALTDNMFHPLKPPWIPRVVIKEIEQLALPGQWIDAIAHGWPIWVVCPELLGILEDIIKI